MRLFQNAYYTERPAHSLQRIVSYMTMPSTSLSEMCSRAFYTLLVMLRDFIQRKGYVSYAMILRHV